MSVIRPSGVVLNPLRVTNSRLLEKLAPDIPLPRMIKLPDSNIWVATSLVCAGQMAALVKRGYEPGSGSTELREILSDPAQHQQAVGFVNLRDGRVLVEEINWDGPKLKYRLPKDRDELIGIFQSLPELFREIDFWLWTEEESASPREHYFLCHPHQVEPRYAEPNYRHAKTGLLLVAENRELKRV